MVVLFDGDSGGDGRIGGRPKAEDDPSKLKMFARISLFSPKQRKTTRHYISFTPKEYIRNQR
jgi:hypothetical protein